MNPIQLARRHRGLTLSALAVASVTLLSACETNPTYDAGYGYGYNQPMYGSVNMGVPNPIYVQTMPPAPIYEVQPAMPFAGAIWIGGNYVWRNNNWAWERGRWEAPRPGYAWQAPHYAPRPGGGATYVPGHWRNPGPGYVTHQPQPGYVTPQPQPYVRPVPPQPQPQYTRPMPPQPYPNQPANPNYRPNHVTPGGVMPPSAHNRPLQPNAVPQPAYVQQQRQERREQMQQRHDRDEWQRSPRQGGMMMNQAPSLDHRP